MVIDSALYLSMRYSVHDERGKDCLTKAFRRGTYRSVAPEQTLAVAEPLLERFTITRVANVTGLDVIGIPVVAAIRPNSRSVSVAQGKGATLNAAKASAIMEAVEGFHAERDHLERTWVSFEALAHGDIPVARVESLPKTTKSKYTSMRPLNWVLSWDLLNEECVWLPHEVVHTRFTQPAPPGSGCFLATSNGLAAGNHMHEAIIHGLCEVIERDARTLWGEANSFPWSRQRTRLDLATVNDKLCLELLDKFHTAGFATAIWNVTSDIGVAAFRCDVTAMVDDGTLDRHRYTGAGCHADRRVALARALTEAAQHRLTRIAGSRDDLQRAGYRSPPEYAVTRQRQIILEEPCGCNFTDVPTYDGETLVDDLQWLLQRVCHAGLDRVLVVNLTLPEYSIPVVRVVVPGLEDSIGIKNYALGPRARAAGDNWL